MSTQKTQPANLGYRLRAGVETAFAEVAQALENAGGHVPTAAQELTVDAATLYRALRTYPQLQLVADRLQGKETDLAVLSQLVPPGVYRVTINAKKVTAETALREMLREIIEESQSCKFCIGA